MKKARKIFKKKKVVKTTKLTDANIDQIFEDAKKKLDKKASKKKMVKKKKPPVLAGDKQAETPERDPNGKFLPGVSGNPNGRKKGRKLWATMVRERMQEIADEEQGLTVEDIIIGNIVDMAAGGSKGMIELIWNYIDGKPNQPMDMSINSDLSDEERAALDNLLQKNKR